MEVTVAGADKKTYRLELEHIALRIFETKIGILTIGLANREHSSPEDILHINEFFRRIYPQFLDSKEGIAETKKKFLADRIKIVWGDKPHQSCEEVLREDYFKEDKYFQLHRQIRACRYIEELLGTGFIENFNYITILDDRMFTICWYGNSWLARSLAQRIGSQYSYLRDEFWARYVFIDGTGLGCANLDFQEEAVKKVTNPRWADYGTFYGFSRYSFVCLTNTSDIARKYLRVHVRTMYYQIVVLLLAQRASILNLANRVSEISAEVKSFIVKSEEQRGEIRKILKEIRDLDADVIHFINRLWFTEITPQEQGIELYNLGQSNMALREQLKELKDEMKDLYEFAELSFQRLQVERINVLTVVGGVLLPLTLLVGFWGMNLAFLQPLFRSENLYILGSNILLSVVFFGLTLLGVTHLTSSMVKIFREDEDKYLKKEKGLCIWKLIGDAILDIWKLVWNRYSTNQKPNRGFKL